jgi:hypothetical protein
MGGQNPPVEPWRLPRKLPGEDDVLLYLEGLDRRASDQKPARTGFYLDVFLGMDN